MNDQAANPPVPPVTLGFYITQGGWIKYTTLLRVTEGSEYHYNLKEVAVGIKDFRAWLFQDGPDVVLPEVIAIESSSGFVEEGSFMPYTFTAIRTGQGLSYFRNTPEVQQDFKASHPDLAPVDLFREAARVYWK